MDSKVKELSVFNFLSGCVPWEENIGNINLIQRVEDFSSSPWN